MYEISLVPDVKGELIKSQKQRNLIITICIVVGIACVAIVLILLGVTGVQGKILKDLDNEIACRYEGRPATGSSCDSKYGTAVLDVENSSEYLTLQDQIANINTLNSQKVRLSRLFGLLDVILLDDDRFSVKASELSINMSDWQLMFEAQGTAANGVHFNSLAAFRESAERTFYDYGDYMRRNKEGEWEAIPTFCIDESIDEKGQLFGIYHKGAKGCEASFDVEEITQEEYDELVEAGFDIDEDKTSVVKDIKIRRSYSSRKDFEDYRDGKGDSAKQKGEEQVEGYYFESKCIQYEEEDDGAIDETATLEVCPILTESATIGEASLGDNTDGNRVLSFSVSLPVSKEIFLTANHYMRIKGPKRQNVTDSYVQVRDLFTSKMVDGGTQ